jgi:hypothetical protein
MAAALLAACAVTGWAQPVVPVEENPSLVCCPAYSECDAQKRPCELLGNNIAYYGGSALAAYGMYRGVTWLAAEARHLCVCPCAAKMLQGVPLAVVGAVAVDTYVLPKFGLNTYSDTSTWSTTDFNSPPRLLHYKNYLAPLPYTHPPMYGPLVTGTVHVPPANVRIPAGMVVIEN